MATTYRITNADNSSQEVTGTTLKVGKGKHASAVLGVRKYEGQGCPAYCIDHIPTGALIADLYFYQSLARGIAEEILEALGDGLLNNTTDSAAALFPPELLWYVSFYRGKDVKKPTTYEEFLNTPDFEGIHARANNRQLLQPSSTEDEGELHRGYKTVAWVPGNRPTGMFWTQLNDIIEGRCLSCTVISRRDEPGGKGD